MARWQMALFGLVVTALIVAILFGSAGRWDVPMFWVYVGAWVVFWLMASLTMDLDLMRDRLRPGGRSKDNLALLRLLGLLLGLGQWIVAGLDVGRYHWSDTVPPAVQTIGVLGFVAALVVIRWAQNVNRFFSPAMRIQTDRGHHVITSGPYRYVRHPGYAAFIIAWLCGALTLGSWWALLLSLVFAGIFVRRAAVEDRFLHSELEGYPEYAAKVRYRLAPGLW